MATFAYYDPARTAPSPVIGWLDTDHPIGAKHFAALPPSGLLPVTVEQFAARGDGTYAVANGALVPYTAPAAQPMASWTVAKVTIVERLNAAGLLRAFRSILKIGVADANLSDAQLLLRERWDAAPAFASNDASLTAALHDAGADPTAILAP